MAADLPGRGPTMRMEGREDQVWIDINKGDEDMPNYRSRLVAKEFNDGAGEGLFASTPPL